MIYNPEDNTTWPEEHQDVLVWSPLDGRTLATFCLENSEGEQSPGFGNWFNRTSDAEDADYIYVDGPCEWWPLPELECMK